MINRERVSVVVVHNGRILTFKGVDPTSGREYFFLPGGGIEDDETAPEAAERECFEETGYRVKVDPSSHTDREYPFHWDGKDYACLTIFYWARLTSPMQTPVRDAAYNHGAVWIPLAEAAEVFSYTAAIGSAVQELLERYV